MRRMLAVVLVATLVVLGGVILGEYQMTWVVGATSGLGVALLLSEVMVGIGRWRGPLPALLTAIASAGTVVWAGVINTNHGRVAFPRGAVLGALLALAVSGIRLLRPR